MEEIVQEIRKYLEDLNFTTNNQLDGITYELHKEEIKGFLRAVSVISANLEKIMSKYEK